MRGLPPTQPGQTPPLVRLRQLSKRFGKVTAVRPLDLDIHRGEFLAILGPSGCGKTTLLRLIGGFLAPTTGSLEIDGADVTHLGPERRPTNMVFQGYGLFPHMTVRQNIAYGLRIKGIPNERMEQRVAEVLALVRLEAFVNRMPDALSGGQAQRVAVARALVMRPKVLLLDEPLAALDLKLRKAMEEELRRIHHSIGGTFVFVTHDQGEALALATRIAVMEDGVICQEGDAEAIYSSPASRFVAGFIGDANILSGHRMADVVTLTPDVSFHAPGRDGPVAVVVRPEVATICDAQAVGELSLSGRIEDIVFLGPYVRYVITLTDGSVFTVHAFGAHHHRRWQTEDEVRVAWPISHHRVLDEP
jgi:spermidine/putrescine transport system ATP-binding protein